MASGVLVAPSEPPPSLTPVMSTVALGLHAAGPSSLRAPLQFVCVDCWHTFLDGSLAACVCNRPRPEKGWAAMPYLFRGRYLFMDLLGRGGMGAVFRAYDQAGGDNPWVAVKVVSQESPERALLRKEMFQKEAAAAQMLAQHKQFFVSVLGHDGVDPAYLALEHISWPTLAGLRDSHPRGARGLPPSQVARIGIALLRGVARIHFHRIVHQDLTPANIFVNHRSDGEGYEVKITDLGIWTYDQVQWDSEALTLVAKPGISGTPNYMSPEQSMGHAVGASSDLHSVGSVLWELATAEVPYPADTDLPPHEFLERRVRALQKPLPRPHGMPHALHKILARALEFEPQKRWSSAPEMCKALEAFVEHCRAQRQRDPGASVESLEGVSHQVTRLEEKFVLMRGLMDRVLILGAMARRVSAERNDLEPEEMHAIADEAEKELAEISNELWMLAGALSFVGGWKKKPSLRPPSMEPPLAGDVTETLPTAHPTEPAGHPIHATSPITQIRPRESASAVPRPHAPEKRLPAWLERLPVWLERRPAWLERLPWPAIGIAVAIIAVAVGYLALRADDESPAATQPATTQPAAPSLAIPAPPAELPTPRDSLAPASVPEVEATVEPPATGSGKTPKTAKTPAAKSPATANSAKGERSLIQENPYK